VNALAERINEQVCLKEYRSCSGGLTHAHCAGQPASRDLVVARQKLDSQSMGGSLKNLNWDEDVIDEYNESLLQDKMHELKYDLDQAKEYKLYKTVYKKFKECKDIDELKDDEMLLLYKYDFKNFKDLDKPKYPDGFVTHYIIDDMIGTNIFKNGRSLFTNLCIRNRHITPSNIIISTQSMMMIPKI
jgi:hypothetical protein